MVEQFGIGISGDKHHALLVYIRAGVCNISRVSATEVWVLELC